MPYLILQLRTGTGVAAPTEQTITGTFTVVDNSIFVPGDYTTDFVNGVELKVTPAPFSYGYAFVISSSFNGTDTEVVLDLNPGNVPNTEAGDALATPIFSYAGISYGISYGFAISGGVASTG